MIKIFENKQILLAVLAAILLRLLIIFLFLGHGDLDNGSGFVENLNSQQDPLGMPYPIFSHIFPYYFADLFKFLNFNFSQGLRILTLASEVLLVISIHRLKIINSMEISKKKNEILISVSLCLFCYNESEKKVLTVRNKSLPFKNALVLPNKLLKYNQSLDEVCTEILTENIGNQEVYIEQLNAFGELYRNPIGRVIDISFYGLINLEKDNVVLNHKNDAKFKNIESNLELAFDHNEMIELALKRIKRRMKYRPLGKNLLPNEFTMNELEGLYSSFLSKKFDTRNFRRRIFEMDILREVKKVQRNSRGRKSILYEFDPKKYENYSNNGF